MYKCIDKYKEVVEDINFVLNEVQENLEIRTNIRDEVLDGMLYTRVRDGYACTLKLIVSDFHLESSIIARTTCEAFFVFKSHIIEPEKAFNNLVSQSKYNQRKIINKTLNNKKYQTHLKHAQEYDMTKLEGAKDVKAHEWANLADEVEHYDYTYSLLSDNVHVNLDSLEKRLDVKEDEIVGFRQLQDDNSLDMILTSIIDIMLKSIKLINTKHKLLNENRISEIEKRFIKLANEK